MSEEQPTTRELAEQMGIPPNAKSKNDSPNKDIDKAGKKLMKELEGDHPLDVKVKVFNALVAWEKAKHNIKDAEDWDPSSI